MESRETKREKGRKETKKKVCNNVPDPITYKHAYGLTALNIALP